MRNLANTRAIPVPYTASSGIDAASIIPGITDTIVDDGDFSATGGLVITGVTVNTPWDVGDNWSAALRSPQRPSIGYWMEHEPGSTAVISQELPLILHGWYRVTMTLDSVTAGSLTPSMGVTDLGGAFDADGTVSSLIFFDSTLDTVLRLVPSSTFAGRVSDVNVTPMAIVDSGLGTDTSFDGDGSDWTLTECSIDLANNWIELWDGAGTIIVKQAVAYTDGNFYLVRVDVSNIDNAINLAIALGTTYNSVVTPLAILPDPADGVYDIPMIPGVFTKEYPDVSPIVINEEIGYILLEASNITAGTNDQTLNEFSVKELEPGSRNIMDNTASVTPNGDFASDTSWTKESGWSIGGGFATSDGTDGTRIYQDLGLLPGGEFLVKFDIQTAPSSGTVQAGIGSALGNEYSAVGTYMDVIQSVGGGTYENAISFLSNAAVDIKIDNVEVYQVASIDPEDRRVFDNIHYSYAGSGTLDSAATLTFVGRGGILKELSIPAKGVGSIDILKDGFYSTVGDPVVAILTAPGANVTGRLNASIR